MQITEKFTEATHFYSRQTALEIAEDIGISAHVQVRARKDNAGVDCWLISIVDQDDEMVGYFRDYPEAD